MTRDFRSSSFVTSRAVVGILVVLVGLAFLGDNLGLIHAGDVLRLWPFALVVLGFSKLFQTGRAGGRVFGAALILFGGLAAADEFWHVSFDVSRWWPLVIVGFGVMIFLKGLRSGSSSDPVGTPSSYGGVPRVGGAFEASTTTESTASEIAVWSGLKRRVSSATFRSATLTAIMGGIEFDLRPASTATGEAVVEVFALWGGIEIIVPPDWAVTTNVVPVLGGVQDRSAGTQASRHRLIVKGTVVMGGVEIKT